MNILRVRQRLLLAALLVAACSTTSHPAPAPSASEPPTPAPETVQAAATTTAVAVPTTPTAPTAREREENVERVPVAEPTAQGQDDSVFEVRFGPGDVTLRDGSRALLDEMYRRLLATRSMYYLELQGHTDATGSAVANLRISELRAEAVESYLHRQRGVPLDAMSVVPLGSAAPATDESTPEGRARNRRVVVVVVRSPAPPIND